ncbi:MULTISPECIES: HlyD family efflux transporter periplasmic adaptor subunit [Aminobacterium]|uniref:HlyD family efflux transporter periplasmic adaptor subunit n=1 Tax=Aminobacterium TaxID=81466 RepID=UPI002580A7C9|nr:MULTISPECIES: HlyD family efflux transporter periplasmic adaptor subunit [unclassified Aminobacterium]
MNYSSKRKVVVYTVFVLCALAGAVWLYGLWWHYYLVTHPRIAQAVPYSYEEELPFPGILLWNEFILTSPSHGRLQYAVEGYGGRVAQGDKIAILENNGSQQILRAPQTGYFIPGLDGLEGQVCYPNVWPGIEKIPNTPELSLFPQGKTVSKGDPIGKFLPMPQDLRIVGYADMTPALERRIDRGNVLLRRDKNTSLYQGEVRVAKKLGYRCKLYLTLPFFPINIVKKRSVSYLISTESYVGVAVPQSSIISREGKLGVFLVEGNYVRFKEVKGFPLSDHSFFISDGLQPGNIILLRADHAREGRIELW